MPPVIALIPVIASIAVAAIGTSALVAAIVVAVATIASMVLMKVVAKKPQGNRITQGSDLATKINPSLPRTVCIGQTGVGPSCHFAYTYTDNADKPNRYLMRVLQISDQPINSLLAIYDGKQTLTFAGDITTGWFACNQHLSKAGVPCMWMRVYKGVFSGAVADATLISNSGGQWTSSHKGTGLAYAIVKYDYDADAFPGGEPELVFSVQGAKLYDDRLDSTVVGGSGSQRLATPSTWTYTDNTAVAIAQYLRGFYIGNIKILGVGAEARDLLPAMLFSAYNTCDQTVAYSGGTEKRYVTGINLGTDQSAQDHLADLSAAMDGKIFDRGGSITIWPGAVRTPVMNLQMQDIDWTAEKSYQPRASLDQLVNCVQGNFIDKDNFYQERDLPVRTNTTWEADDGGQRFSQFVSLKGVNRWSQGQRVMHRVHQASRFNSIAGFVGGIWLLEMEQGDWFTLTASHWDVSSKYYEVHEITLTRDMKVAIVAEEVATSLDDWAPASNEFARNDTYWNAPTYDLPVPTFTITDYYYNDATSGHQEFGKVFTLLTPTGISGTYVKGVEIQYAKLSDLATTTSVGVIPLDQPRKLISPLEPDTDYAFRARSTDGSRFGAWSSWPGVITDPGGGSTTPPDTSLVDAVTELSNFVRDDKLGMSEKKRLITIAGKLDLEYWNIIARTSALGISTTSLTTARTLWQNQLGFYTPAWNDTKTITPLYDSVFSGAGAGFFPITWTKSSLSTTGGSPNTNLTDSSASQWGVISLATLKSGARQYSAGIRVAKDAVGKATRFPLLRVDCTGGTAKQFGVSFDTLTGEFASTDANVPDAYDVLDMGWSWFVYLVFTTNSNNTGITVSVFPAVGSGALASSSYSAARTGTIQVGDPLLAYGSEKALGGEVLIARENDYVAWLKYYGSQVSNVDGSISNYADGPTSANVLYNNAGTTIQDTVDLNYYLRTGISGAVVTSGVTMAYTVVTGTVNGFNNASGAHSMAVTSGVGLLVVTAMTTDTAQVKVSITSGGLVRTYTTNLTRVLAPVDGTGTGGGGGGGGGTSSSQTSGFLGITGSYATYQVISNTLAVTTGPAQTAVTAILNLSPRMNKSANQDGPWDVQYKWQRDIGGTWTDQGAVQHSNPDPSVSETSDDQATYRVSESGTMSSTQSLTGLAVSTAYSLRVVASISSGVLPTNGAGLTHTGSVSVA